MQFTKQFTSAIATGALVLSMATPAFAQTTEILGNGAGSINVANQDSNTNTNVGQNNTAVVTNVVSTNSNSGGNNANFNTGGTTTVVSGAAKSNATVTTAVNANSAQVNPCDCPGAGAGNSTEISGNGAGSLNNVNSTQNNNTNVGQNNNAVVTNLVNSNANSGNNTAAFNTGGATTVVSGPAEANASVLTAANVNVAKVGSPAGAGVGAGTSALITGNGAGSLNTINLLRNNNTNLGQNNSAVITNLVSSNANSGNNAANFNTGGDTVVVAGPATANVKVDNLANFNWADLSGCGCPGGVATFKLAGNGAGSLSVINSTKNNNTNLGQSNLAVLLSVVDANANSGGNASDFNTGAPGLGDPVVVSGNAVSNTQVSNLANWNGAGVGVVTLPGGGSANLLFDLTVLLVLLHLV